MFKQENQFRHWPSNKCGKCKFLARRLLFSFKFMIFLFQCQFFVHEAQSSFVRFPVSVQVHRRNVIEA